MDTLPPELLENIFQHLLRRTLYQCALVCHHWTPTAEKCLYQAVKIHQPETLEIFINTMMINPSKRNHITKLALFPELIDGLSIGQVLTMFPRLQTAKLYKRLSRTIHRQITFPVSIDMCPRLETLEIFLYPGEMGDINPIEEFSSMPVLKKNNLVLVRLELYLNDATAIQSGDIDDIQPSISTKSIHWGFSDISNLDEYLGWFRFIQKKYPHLDTLSISDVECYSREFDINMLFVDGWSPLLHSLSRLKSIDTINVPSGVNVFKVLDEAGCKMERLQLCSDSAIKLDGFIQFEQCHHIVELLLESMEALHNISLRDTKLVTLSLYYKHEQTLLLNTLLKLCPDTLETLTLDNVIAEIDANDDFQSCITCLEVNFHFLFEPVEWEFEEKLKKLCPNLKTQNISPL